MGNNKTCPYCSPSPKDRVPVIENRSDFLAIEPNGAIAFGNDWSVTFHERIFKFCPMCGRELNNGKNGLSWPAKHDRRATMNKEERIEQIEKVAQKAIYAVSDTADELPELKPAELLIILYAIFLDVANTLEQDPDLLYLFMKKEIGYTNTEDGRTLNFPLDLIQGDDE
jgi:hypothetical protein